MYSSSYVIDLLPNPDLAPETIHSYQMGMEAGISRRARFKLSFAIACQNPDRWFECGMNLAF